MSELRESSPERPSSELDEILTTKLQPPRTRSDLLLRPRLVDALDAGVSKQLVLVSTPAGFGKTTLLANWVPHAHRPVAWLSLDRLDDDPSRFIRYVVAAVDRVRPGFGKGILALFTAREQISPKAMATAFVNALAAQPEELVLVLDDYHVIESPEIHDALRVLLASHPPQVCLVISSRSDPPVPLARLRGHGQLTELRAADLRFSAEETASLLQHVWGLDLSAEAIGILADRTEGWIAGLQLAAISLRGRSDGASFVEGFAGSNRYVIDYLMQEVLERQPDPVRAFLLETSGLERWSGALCDAVTGRSDGQQMLESLERDNLFLIPLDDARHWYRYHHLFADMLRARLKALSPGRVPEVNRRAAAWSEEHGLIEDALGYALGADDPSWAARLIEEHTDALMRRGEGATLQRWFARLPGEVIRSRSRLCLTWAIAEFNAGRLDVVESLLHDAERASSREEPARSLVHGGAGPLGNVPATVALLRASLAGSRGDAERTMELAREAQALVADDDHASLFAVRWNLAMGVWMQGRMVDAERALADIVADGWNADQPHLSLSACRALGQVQRARGRLGEALCTYRRGLGAAVEGRGVQSPAGAALRTGIAEVSYDRNDLEDALLQATQVALCHRMGHAQPLANALASHANDDRGRGERADRRRRVASQPGAG